MKFLLKNTEVSAAVSSLPSPFLTANSAYRNDFIFPDSVPEVPDIIVDSGQRFLLKSECSYNVHTFIFLSYFINL